MKADNVSRWFHRVGALLGRRVSELRQVMSHPELLDWIAFHQLEPWGDQAANWRAAVVAAEVANVPHVAFGNRAPHTAQDIYRRCFETDEPQRQTGAQMKAMANAWLAAVQAGSRKG